MTIKTPFGNPMRRAYFTFSPTYTPINHGSFGCAPLPVLAHQNHLQTLASARPDTFIVRNLPLLIDESRSAIAPFLGVDVDEVVLIPNASTGINTVLRNLKWEEGDVIVYFSTIYSACEKSVASIQERVEIEGVKIELQYPVEDEEIVRLLRETIRKVQSKGKRARLAMFDTVLTFPGARMPWEALVDVCKEMGVLSLIDGAHGVGHIDLQHLGRVSPDFFVTNCHKWLFTPRSCAVFYVPFRNQPLIRTSLPTSHGYQYLDSSPEPIPVGKSPFVHLFEFVATIDYSPYACIPAALEFRKRICGGEQAIRNYCYEIARIGGQRAADILGTEVMFTESRTMNQCCFANVELPLKFENTRQGDKTRDGTFDISEAGKIGSWINDRGVKDYDTYLQIAFHAGKMWVRLSGQIYLEVADFEWVGAKLNMLCERVQRGE
ncbi:PLP-dependent transferase, partial [Stipitochalara longipes BDJ]